MTTLELLELGLGRMALGTPGPGLEGTERAGVSGLSPLGDLRGVQALSAQHQSLLPIGGGLVFGQDDLLVLSGESPSLRPGGRINLRHASILGATVGQCGWK